MGTAPQTNDEKVKAAAAVFRAQLKADPGEAGPSSGPVAANSSAAAQPSHGIVSNAFTMLSPQIRDFLKAQAPEAIDGLFAAVAKLLQTAGV